MSPIILVGAAILLFALGLGAGLGIAMWRNKGEKGKASEIQEELDDYRRNVTEHFSETAQHFQAIGEQYKSLYQHMAKGAGALCDTTQSEELLGFAAAGVPAIESSKDEHREESPEVIRDYAPEDEVEAASAEPEPAVDTAEPETADQAVVSEEKTGELQAEAKEKEKPAAEEVLAEKVSAAISVDSDRTVH